MNEDQVYNQLFSQFINTVVLIIAVTIFGVSIYFFIKRKAISQKIVNKIRSRVIYISIVIFLLGLIRIWIEGFTHLFTMLSLVGAGLVVTNKENIMNFTGWIIINWRGLFSEGDSIQVQTYVGEVTDIRLLYFTIRESVNLGVDQPTGRIVKIPNGLIITSPVISFSSECNIMWHSVPYIVNINENTIKIADDAKKYIFNLWQEKYQFNTEITKGNVLDKSKFTRLGISDFQPKVELKTFHDKDKMINIQTSFYCFSCDEAYFERCLVEFLINLDC